MNIYPDCAEDYEVTQKLIGSCVRWLYENCPKYKFGDVYEKIKEC